MGYGANTSGTVQRRKNAAIQLSGSDYETQSRAKNTNQ